MDEDTLRGLGLILFALILIILFLAFITSGSGAASECPPGTFPCEESPCGCCVLSGGKVDACSACEGYMVIGDKCCLSSNPEDCLGMQPYCVNPETCESEPCCPGFSCELGQDGIRRCQPCEQGLTCDPQIGCCGGMACNCYGDECKCLPCDSRMQCSSDEDCCQDSFCDPSTGLCTPCEGEVCQSDEDCCDDYECVNGVCRSCVRDCVNDDECCNGWECVGGECQSCLIDCAVDDSCCDGYVCLNGRCAGCEEGTVCDPNHPCCEGYACVDGECVSCDRECSVDSDCCTGGICKEGSCVYPDACAGFECDTPGEPCHLCSDGNCIDCVNAICVKEGDHNVCKAQGSCGEGQYVCDGCESGCCDALTGKCACRIGHPCESYSGCECCLYDSRIFFCRDGYVCEREGRLYCFDPSCVAEKFEGDPLVCEEDKGLHVCSFNESECCVFIAPAAALADMSCKEIPALSGVDMEYASFDECLGGYRVRFKEDYVCCYLQDFDKPGEKYTYTFYCPDADVHLTSTFFVGPSERKVGLAKPKDFCSVAMDGLMDCVSGVYYG